MPRISIIVPVYKAEKYLDECVQSIVDQTLADIEIILVDDGSPDNCPQMCDDWAKKDNRIRVFHKENGGLSSAVLSGIKNSSCDVIGFVDSDDYVKENMFKNLVENMEKTGADCVCCGYTWEGDGEGRVRDFEKDMVLEKDDIEEKILRPFFEKTCQFNIYWNTQRVTKVFKKELLLYKGLLENGYKMDIGEDVVLSLRYLRLCQKVSVIADSCNYFCRANENSTTNLFSDKTITKNDTYINDLYNIATEQDRPINAISKRSDVIFGMIMWQCFESMATVTECIYTNEQCYKRIKDKGIIGALYQDFNFLIKLGFYLVSKGRVKIGTYIIYFSKKLINIIIKK